ncbi:MAG: superoxide dismutase family protein [Halanaerobiales bacterium]|nr:superoxide dismutase family protein [Halanaerobiales bacterium]
MWNPHIPVAYANINSGPLAPNLKGKVFFFEVPDGTEVYVDIIGLPKYQPAKDGETPIGPHGFHIHEFGNCEIGDPKNPFQAAGGHWNPTNQPHGNHAGDFPILFSNHGHARMRVFTDKFKVSEVIGKAIIIHQNPDDYRSQPSGNAGKRLACGVVKCYSACCWR